MSRIAPYYTSSTQYPPTHRDVYHEHNECRYGREINRKDLMPGKGHRPLCKECIQLSA